MYKPSRTPIVPSEAPNPSTGRKYDAQIKYAAAGSSSASSRRVLGSPRSTPLMRLRRRQAAAPGFFGHRAERRHESGTEAPEAPPAIGRPDERARRVERQRRDIAAELPPFVVLLE